MAINKFGIMSHIEITTQGIQKVLRKIDVNVAIAEYIWNGFDAGATSLEINVEELNELGAIGSVTISDNGSGIELSKLTSKFRKFYESEKRLHRNHSLPHGNNGYGRFSFIAFANKAEWQTIYEGKESNFQYDISMDKNNLQNYYPGAEQATTRPTGTTVVFTEIEQSWIKESLTRSIERYVNYELGWFLVLHPEFKVTVCGNVITGDTVILDPVSVKDATAFSLKHQESGIIFGVRYVQWRKLPHPEYSKFYYLDSKGKEAFKENTRLNNQGDKYYHSMYVTSTLFDDFVFTATNDKQTDLSFSADRKADEFGFLEKELLFFLKRRRRPYLQELSVKTSDEYIKIGAIKPVTESSTVVERVESEITKELVEELFKIEPRLFSGFSREQKIIFGRMLSLMIQNGNMRDDLMKVIGGAIEMTEADMREFTEVVERLSFKGLSKLAHVVTGRYDVYDRLKAILFNETATSKEKDIQLLVQDELWLIDEKYNLITAEEPDFEEALRRILEFTTGESVEEKPHIDSPDRQKEMDVFACRKRKIDGTFEHIVIELKRASHRLSKKDADQLFTYQQVIMKEKRFSNPDCAWRFYLIGTDYATDGYIEAQKRNSKSQGLPNLFYKDESFECYAMTWAQLIERFEINHDYLKQQINDTSEELLSVRHVEGVVK